MSATKILWGQITVVFLIVLLTIWGAMMAFSIFTELHTGQLTSLRFTCAS